jgi:predicted transcriptional regulator
MPRVKESQQNASYTFRLSASLLERLQQVAKNNHRTVAMEMRLAIAKYVKEAA